MRDQIVAGIEIEQRRNEARIQLERPRFATEHAGHLQCRVSVQRLALGQQPQILARHCTGFSERPVFSSRNSSTSAR